MLKNKIAQGWVEGSDIKNTSHEDKNSDLSINRTISNPGLKGIEPGGPLVWPSNLARKTPTSGPEEPLPQRGAIMEEEI